MFKPLKMDIGMDCEISLPLGAVTLVSALHTAYVARQSRKRLAAHTVMTRAQKAMFERTLKAHKKCVAFYPIFLLILWTSGLLFNEELAAVLGCVYILGRQMYSCGQRSTAKIWRYLGFYLVIAAVLLLSLTGIFSLLHIILDPYIDFDHLLNHLLSYLGLYSEPTQYYFF